MSASSKILFTLALLFLLVTCAGCSTMAPNQVDACLTHVSHPLQGAPFGPSTQEDSLDTVGACATWERGRVSFESGLGYKYKEGGFYGDDFIFQGQLKVKLWEKRQ